MTNREKFIEVFGDNPQRHHITKSWWDEEYVPSQEPILDKIRAEIVEMWQHEPCAIESGCLDEVLEVIDKYKAESEE